VRTSPLPSELSRNTEHGAREMAIRGYSWAIDDVIAVDVERHLRRQRTEATRVRAG
jgi:hypothetical protein